MNKSPANPLFKPSSRKNAGQALRCSTRPERATLSQGKRNFVTHQITQGQPVPEDFARYKLNTGPYVLSGVKERFFMARRSRSRSVEMTAARRRRLAPAQFALPGRRYPIDTLARARNALARVAQHGTRTEQATVRRKVHARWPSIEVSGLRKKK
jgi:hypothetical protein